MANTLANLARMYTETAGTGTLTLISAVPGFNTFAEAGVPDGATITYAIYCGPHREIGAGVWTATTKQLTRATVYSSTSGGNRVTLSGRSEVFITPAKEDFSTFLTAIPDGDYGDIVVSGGGSSINIDSAVATTFGRSLMDDADATAGRATLQLGTIATQDANNVAITGGTIAGITDLAVADGGTGASDAGTARTNLGLAIGTNVQAYDAGLAALAAYNTNGILTQTAVDTFVGRSIAGGTNIAVTNGDGVSGNPTIAFSGTLPVTSGGTGAATLTGVVKGTGTAALTASTIVDADVNASAAIAPTKLAFTQAGTGAQARTVDAKLKERVSVEDFGAVGNGTTDDTAAFQAAIDYVAGLGGGTVSFSKKYLIDDNLTVKNFVALEGSVILPGQLRYDNPLAYNSSAAQLIVNSTKTISLKDGASVGHAVVIRKGLTLPFADASAANTALGNFAGTAFTVAGTDAYFYHLLILGFNKAIYSFNYERIRCEFVQGDCTNGIDLQQLYDIAYINDCHFWPFTTVHQGFEATVSTILTRSGTAYKFAAIADWCKFTNCFSYGYANGFVIDGCNSVNLIGCGTDYPTTLSSTSIGFEIKGSSQNTLLFGCQAAAQGTGIKINTTASPGAGARVTNCAVWDCDTTGVDVTAGTVIVDGCEIRNSGTGLSVNATDGTVVATSNTFENNATAAITLTGAALRRSVVRNNKYIGATAGTIGESLGNENNLRSGIVYAAGSTNDDGYTYEVRRSRGTLTSPTQATTSDLALRLKGAAMDNAGAYREIGAVRLQATDNVTSTSAPGMWIFSTVPAASTTPVDRMFIYPDGGVVVGSGTGASKGDATIFCGAAYVGQGSAAGPSIAAGGDSDTGMFFPAANVLALSQGGAEALRISSGNVQIGTTSGAGKLHTKLVTGYSAGSAWDNKTAVFGGEGASGAGSGALGIAYNDTDGAAIACIVPGVVWKPISFYANELVFCSGGNVEQMRVTVGGNVEAKSSLHARSGTAIPAGGTAGAGLLVSSTSNFGVFFGSGAPTLSAAKGSLYLRSDGTTTNDRAYINTNGSTTWTALTTAA